MSLLRLKISNFRNLINLNLEFSQNFNLIYGANGSGKSSILESIYFLSLGRSFRSHLATRIINYEQETLAIFGNVCSATGIQLAVGIEKVRTGKLRIKIANEPASSIASLANILPLQLINPDSYQLLSSGPSRRRQFLDWGVFHVEQNFFSIWQRLQRVLKQRNSALNQKANHQQIKIWDPEFVALSKQLSHLRANYIEKLKPVIYSLLDNLIKLEELTLEFNPGWDERYALEEVLDTNIGRDFSLGYTQYGPQRADIIIKVKGIPAEDVLSRGEQKLLVYALQLAQGVLMLNEVNKHCVYLLDDIAAELDEGRRERIMQVLKNLKAQVFITAVDKEVFTGLIENVPHKLFHVKHGMIIP